MPGRPPPWIDVRDRQDGYVEAYCHVCRQGGLMTPPQALRFAQLHSEHRSAAPTHLGLGDAFRAVTQALGVEDCTPCEKRRVALNNFAPRVFRR